MIHKIRDRHNDKVLQQLMFEKNQLDAIDVSLRKNIPIFEEFLANKFNEQRIFRDLKIVGFDDQQRKEIDAYKKNLDETKRVLAEVKESIISVVNRINIIQK